MFIPTFDTSELENVKQNSLCPVQINPKLRFAVFAIIDLFQAWFTFNQLQKIAFEVYFIKVDLWTLKKYFVFIYLTSDS